MANGDGGRAAESLMCEPWVTAVAVNSYMGDKTGNPFGFCGDRRPAAMLLVPTDSKRLPINGEIGCLTETRRFEFGELERLWTERNGCRGEPEVTTAGGGGQCRTWSCDVPFESCRVAGGEGWPGSRLANLCGEPPPSDFLTEERIWSFFDRVPPLSD